MTQYLQKINDVYFINEKIKEVNQHYELYYNTKLKRYEVHDLSNKICTFCISQTEYPNFSLIIKLFKTKRENAKKYLNEIENHNKELEIKQENHLLDSAKTKFSEVINFANKSTNKNLSREQILNIIT